MFPLEPAHIVLAILVGSLVLFVTEAVRYDVVALLVVLLLALTGCLPPKEAFMGLASPAVVLIGSMYVFGHAFSRWGVAQEVGRRFLRGAAGNERALSVRITGLAGLLSALLSNTAVVATLIPVCSGLSRDHRVPVSRLLMPMVFGSLLGGLVTVVATSTNIAINQVIREYETAPGQAPPVPFGLFDFSHLGLILLAAGVLYFLGPGRLLIPRSPVDQTLSERYQVPKFVTEVLVEPASELIDRAVADVEIFSRHHVTVLGLVRAGGKSTVLAPGPYNRIRPSDTLILQGTPDDLVRLSAELPLEQRTSVETAGTRLYSDDVRLVEAVIPAGSQFVGQTLLTAEFRSRTGLNVLAMAKAGEVQLTRLHEMSMEVGDTLLVQGHQRDTRRARRGRDLLMLDEVPVAHFGRKAWITVAMLAAVLLLAAVTPIDLSVLGLAGALGLVLLGAVRAEEVPRVIDWSVIALVGGMLALGHALDRYGFGAQVAEWLRSLGAGGLDGRALIVVVLLATVLLTQILNNVSTAVIMTPVAIDLAANFGFDSRPFLMAVVTGSSLAFLTPVAHQANAMVMGPGGLRYRDFLRVGAPLLVLTVVITAVCIPLFWPLVPGV